MKVIGNAAVQTYGRRLDNRVESSHQPLGRRGDRSASIHNHFNHDRHLDRRDIFDRDRSAALDERRRLAT